MLRDLPASEQSFSKWYLAKTFSFVATFVGLFLGICEGIILFFTLRHTEFPALIAGKAILIIAPLVDTLAFGLLGGVLGIAAEFFHRNHPRVASRLASLGLLIAGVYATFVPAHALFPPDNHSPLVAVSFSMVGGLAVVMTGRWVWRYLRQETITIATRFWPRWQMLAGGVAFIFAASLLCLATSRIIVTPPPHSLERSERVGKQPNVVMIVLDTARADHLSAYGYSQSTTPNLDNLAKQGVLFETAVAPAPWTLPSFSAVFTGLLPHQNPSSWGMPLREGTSTLASILRSRGYQTAGFNANYMVGTRRTGLAQGFDVYDDDDGSMGEDLAAISSVKVFWWLFYYPFVRPDSFVRRDAGELNQAAFRWFKHRSQQPFFFLINYYDLHEPYSAAPGVGMRFGDGRKTLAQRIRAEVERAPLQILPPRSPSEQASILAGYDGALNYTDSQIGALLHVLEASPEWPNTYLIVMSDHGQAFGEHRHYGHDWGLNWELLHVPLILTGPGIPHDRRVSDTVSLQQVFATVLDLSEAAGTAPEPSSLRCYWTFPANTCDANPLVISEFDGSSTSSDAEASISAVTPGWQYIRDSAGTQELYNLASDPHEDVNLAASSDYRTIVSDIQHNIVGKLQASPLPWLGESYLTSLGQSNFMLLTGRKVARLSSPTSKPRNPPDKDHGLLRSLPYQ